MKTDTDNLIDLSTIDLYKIMDHGRVILCRYNSRLEAIYGDKMMPVALHRVTEYFSIECGHVEYLSGGLHVYDTLQLKALSLIPGNTR